MKYLFGGVVNVHDPGQLGGADGVIVEQVCADNTFISDRLGGRRRPGRTQRVSGKAHSGFSTLKGDQAFMVQSGVLKRLVINQDNGTITTEDIKTLSTDARMTFEQVNHVIVCSNGVDFGIIDNGVWYDRQSPTARFKRAMPAANHLTFYRGHLYGALGSIVTRSDPYNLEKADKRLSKIPIPGVVGMLQAVSGGMWLSNGEQIIFIRGTGMEDYTYEVKADYPAIPYAYCLAYGEKLRGLELTDKVVIFGSQQGICVGTSDGLLLNLSQEKVSFNTGLEGSIILMERDGQVHIVLSLDNSIDAFNPYERKDIPRLDFSDEDNSQYMPVI